VVDTYVLYPVLFTKDSIVMVDWKLKIAMNCERLCWLWKAFQ